MVEGGYMYCDQYLSWDIMSNILEQTLTFCVVNLVFVGETPHLGSEEVRPKHNFIQGGHGEV